MSHDALIHDALDRAERDRATTQADAELLLAARGDDLERLLDLASSIRDEGLAATGRDGVITYSRKVFVPITKLCRDRCHYCIFVDTPGGLAAKGESTFMEPEEILQVARDGAALGCKEALFTLGDRPEDRWPVARQWLAEHGYSSTIEYIRAMAIRVTEETGLLCHLNPGVMSWAELQRLRPVAPSMGMMLETTATRLWSEKGGVHYGSPDKDPALRMRVIDDAGRARVPFTTGVLLGIGENDAERAEALFAIRGSHETFGHVQETIVQNFRAKPRTAMQNEVDLELQEYIAAVAVARLVMGPIATIQAPPNLTDAQELGLLIRAGIDDWGGVSPLTADHVNPERPWPNIDDLATLTRASGYELRERLTAHPPYLADPETWIDARLHPHLEALTDPSTHLAIQDAPVVGRPYEASLRRPVGTRTPLIERAAADPAGLSDPDYVALLNTDGNELDALAALADDVRRERVGDEISFVANRNLDSTMFGPSELLGPDALTHERLSELVAEAVELGASEICLQGAVSAAPGYDYLDLIERIHTQAPELHLHAFRPAEVLDGAARLGLTLEQFLVRLREAGVGTVPGTGARILDQRIRDVLSGNTDPSVESWADAITTAHRAGLRSTATMVYGHIETPEQQLAHLRRLAELQDAAIAAGVGGFTEFIAMPFVPSEMLLPDGGSVDGARPGPSLRETRAVHAVARLLLAGRIDNVQTAWTKVGLRTAQTLLMGGANDLGGLLLDGTIRPEAGAEAYRQLSLADVQHVAAELGRPVRQRSTDYGVPTHPLTAANAAAPVRMRLPLRERRAS
ncbi:7,8-didemethyl-8-hydroxy-5-deazariboflavin synthase CofG [Microbacteriaceae bacterium VKM Ac-2855]|nr:7,8-didemethyl-8-hydroxy-5-deazariboflavin synthase CofG [Microbacteriaceae bacterium VKM Ac-2855]